MNAHQAKGDVSAVSETHHPYTTMNPDSGNVDSETLTLPAPATYASSSPLRRPRKRWSRRCVLCTCCYFFLLLVVSIGIYVLLQWFIIQSKDGNYDLQDAHLQMFHLSRNSTEYELDIDMDLEFLFSNPNCTMGFNIKGINVLASYVGEEIGQSPDLPPFNLASETSTTVGSEIRSVNTVLLSETAGAALQGEIGRNNSVSLLVVMNAKVRNDHHMLNPLHPYRGVRLACFVNLAAPNGTVPGNLISKSCSVHRGS